MVNKLVGMILQVLGGLLVLYSVNDNLGLFRSQSLTAAVFGWFKAFPIVKSAIALVGSAISSSSGSASLAVGVGKPINTLEERVAEVERLLAETRKHFAREVQALICAIEGNRADFIKQIHETSNLLTALSKRMEHAAVGGFKFQALGVLFAIYGAITNLYA